MEIAKDIKRVQKKASSIYIPLGMSVTLFERGGYNGISDTYTESVSVIRKVNKLKNPYGMIDVQKILLPDGIWTDEEFAI